MITVGLPVYRQSLLLPLVLSGLSRQKNAGKWELIICTEDHVERILYKYRVDLRRGGCKEIKFIKLKNWIPLPQKWRLIGQNMDPSSAGLILQAADCFPHNKRIHLSRKAMNEDYDWYHENRGYFYDIRQSLMAEYWSNSKHTHLNICMAAKHAQNLETSAKRNTIDGWLRSHIRQPKVFINKNIYLGVDFAGYSNISTERSLMITENQPPFTRTDVKLSNILPADLQLPDFPVINILTRTLQREKQFNICRISIKNQTYKNVRHIVGSEIHCEYYPYAIILEKKPQSKIRPAGLKHCPWNLHFADLYKHVHGGWIIHIDDDDMFADRDSLECLVRAIDHEDQLLLWRTNIRGRLVPGVRNFGSKIVRGDISGIGFMFHSRHLPVDWGAHSCGDYKVIKELSTRLKIKWIHEAWTFKKRGVPIHHTYFTQTQNASAIIENDTYQVKRRNKQKISNINNLPI